MRVAAAVAIVVAGTAVALVVRGESQLYVPMLLAAALGIGLAVLLGAASMMLALRAHRRGDDAAAAQPLSESDRP